MERKKASCSGSGRKAAHNGFYSEVFGRSEVV